MSTPCHLLALPTELRLKIAEYALTSGEVSVTTTLKQPPLLSTCRQIRAEALSIWYTDNTFIVNVVDCNASIARSFNNFVCVSLANCNVSLREIRIAWSLKGRPNWGNLMRSCKMIHEGELRGFCGEVEELSDQPVLSKVAYGAFAIVNELQSLEWKQCERALRCFRLVAGTTDAAWMEDA